MAIYQRGKIWYVDYYEGKKRVKKAVGHKKTDAIAYLGKIQGAKKENRLFDMKKNYNFTFDELLERYIETFRDQKAFRSKMCNFPILRIYFSGKRLSDITSYDLQKFRNERKATPVKTGIERVFRDYKVKDISPKIQRERSVADVNRILSTLRHMFTKAVEWEMMEKSPFSKVKNLFYKENNRRLRFLTEDEEERLLFYCKDHLKPIVITALNTGMRKGEILKLKWPQIRNGFIYLHKTKTNESRQIPLNDTLNNLFKSLPVNIKSEYVFCDSEGKPYDDIKKSFNHALKKSCIEDFHFHDLRHTFASRLVMRRASLKAVQELLGHKDIKMTMRYAHLSEDFKRDAVKLLDGNVNQGSPKIVPKGVATEKVGSLNI